MAAHGYLAYPELRLVNNLATWTTAPNGIKKLRELILELAVRGLLVPQDANDEPVSVLLEKIAAEKARLVSQGKIKPPKPLPKISEAEKPFVLPKGWEWIRLGDLGITQTGTTPPTSNPEFFGKDYPFIKPADISYDSINYNNDGLSEEGINKGRLIKEFSVLMVCIGGSIGKVNFVDRDCSCNQQINAITPYLSDVKALSYFMGAGLFQQQVLSEAPQTTLPILSKGKWEKLLIPLPPLAEQHRIVAKVDELMQLCDQLEQKQNHSQQTHRQLVSTLLTTLTEAHFQAAWSRIAANFDAPFTTLSSVEQLQKTILQLAVRGVVVPQNPDDEPASELLKKIAEEKARLIAEGKIRKQNPLPKISESEKPFNLPDNWEWVKLDNLALLSEAGWSPKCESTPRENDRWAVLKVSAVTWGKFNPNENKELPSNFKEKPEYEVHSGDFLISRANTADLVARAVIVPENAPKKLMMSDKIIRFVFSSKTDANFINLVNSSEFSRNYYARVAGGTSSSMKNVSREQIRNLVFALPPLAEQHRIVAKVDELMTLCEQLKTKLQTAQTLQQQLAQTLVQQAVA